MRQLGYQIVRYTQKPNSFNLDLVLFKTIFSRKKDEKRFESGRGLCQGEPSIPTVLYIVQGMYNVHPEDS